MGEHATDAVAGDEFVVPDTSRGRFLRGAEREAMRLAEQRRLRDLWDRAARREILLTGIPADDRWAVRKLHAETWEWSGGGITSVIWPAGHVDPFAGREDDEFIGPDVRVRFADEAPDIEADPDGWFAFWYGCEDEPIVFGDIADCADGDAGDEWAIDGTAPEVGGEDEDGAAQVGEPRAVGGAALPASAFPAVVDIPLALPREEADLPAVVEQAPVSATRRFVGRWLGAPVSDLRWTKIAVGPDGSVWQSLVADDEVRRYDATGRLIDRYGGPADERTRFRAPLGLAVHPDGSVFVADNEHARVQRIAPDGTVEPDWFAFEPRPCDAGGFVVTMSTIDPVDVAVRPDGQEILVLDFGWRLLYRLDAAGIERFPDGELERTNKAINLSVSADGNRGRAGRHGLPRR